MQIGKVGLEGTVPPTKSIEAAGCFEIVPMVGHTLISIAFTEHLMYNNIWYNLRSSLSGKWALKRFMLDRTWRFLSRKFNKFCINTKPPWEAPYLNTYELEVYTIVFESLTICLWVRCVGSSSNTQHYPLRWSNYFSPTIRELP